MIGKIMSEASHSIIGMLSAKPSDMETRTANNEFSSLLLPGENRPRPALDPVRDNASVEGAKDHSGNYGDKGDVEEFLNQLIGSDAQSVLPAIEPNIAKTIGFKLPVEDSEGATELSPETPTPPVALPGNALFISAAQPLSSGPASTQASAQASGGDEALPNAGTALDLSQRSSGLLRSPLDADIDRKLPARTEVQTASVATDKQSAILPAPISNTQISNIPASKDAKKTSAAAKPYSDAGATDMGKAIGITDKAPVTSASSQVSGSAQQMRDLLDLRAASTGKAEISTPKQATGSQALESKTVKAETKLPFADMDNLPAAGHLEKTIELSASAPAAPVAAAHNATAKTVSFDWNAPQFAERFASELADLNVNGDLKKFEINPRNMGRLEVSFFTRGAAEIVRIEADNNAVREMIVQHSQAIQDLLKANGRPDLSLRVDVRENMFAASDNGGMNFTQQGGTSGSAGDRASERDNGSTPSRNRGTAIPAESETGLQGSSDNSRYA